MKVIGLIKSMFDLSKEMKMEANSNNALLKKIGVVADKCTDISVMQREIETAPRDSEVQRIWRNRLCEVVSKSVPRLTFWEAVKERYNYEHSEKTLKLLDKRTVETAGSIEFSSTKEAFRAYYLVRDICNEAQKESIKLKCCKLASAEAAAWATIGEAHTAIIGMDLSYKDRHPDFLHELFRPYLRMLSFQHATRTAPLCADISRLRECVHNSSDKEKDIWRARLTELEDEEAQKEAPVCNSANDARCKLLYVTKGTKAEVLWTECYLRLSKIHARTTNDVKEVAQLCEHGVGNGKEMYMTRYLELCLERLEQKW